MAAVATFSSIFVSLPTAAMCPRAETWLISRRVSIRSVVTWLVEDDDGVVSSNSQVVCFEPVCERLEDFFVFEELE